MGNVYNKDLNQIDELIESLDESRKNGVFDDKEYNSFYRILMEQRQEILDKIEETDNELTEEEKEDEEKKILMEYMDKFNEESERKEEEKREKLKKRGEIYAFLIFILGLTLFNYTRSVIILLIFVGLSLMMLIEFDNM